VMLIVRRHAAAQHW